MKSIFQYYAPFKNYSNRKNILSFNQCSINLLFLLIPRNCLFIFENHTRRVSFCYFKYNKIAISVRDNIQFDIFLFYFISILRIFLQFPYVLYRIDS